MCNILYIRILHRHSGTLYERNPFPIRKYTPTITISLKAKHCLSKHYPPIREHFSVSQALFPII